MHRLNVITKTLFSVWLFAVAVTSCDSKRPEFASFPKADVHVHLRTFDATFVQQAITDNFRLLSICVRSSSQDYIDEQFERAKYQTQKFPETVAFVTTFSMEEWGTENWQTKTIYKLKQDFDAGAIGVKVWKDIGMTFRDRSGKFIMIDDPVFDPVFDFIASENKIVVAHIGEPKNCWLPLDSMTVNNDRGYFKNHPEYHMYLHPEYPTYDEQIAARDHMLEKHPDLTVIGAHLGSLEWDVDELAKRLDRFPNFAVDMAARICHFQVQDRTKVRNFIQKYQDRLLYATDLGQNDDSDPVQLRERLHQTWYADWQYFATDTRLTSDAVNGSFQGLYLDNTTLKKIYYKNAVSWLTTKTQKPWR
jgi:predicted TIM-barrel fold metal-dependent hydrolase